MVNKCMKKYTKSLINREMQINTTRKHQYPVRMATIKETDNIKYGFRYMEQPQLCMHCSRNVTNTTTVGKKLWQFIIKLNTQQFEP